MPRCVFRRTPGALPKVLLSVRSWEPDCLVDLYGLLDTWPKPDIIGASIHFFGFGSNFTNECSSGFKN